MSNAPHEPTKSAGLGGLPGSTAPGRGGLDSLPGDAPAAMEFRASSVGASSAPLAAPVHPGSPGSVYVSPPMAYGQQAAFGGSAPATGDPAQPYGVPAAPPYSEPGAPPYAAAPYGAAPAFADQPYAAPAAYLPPASAESTAALHQPAAYPPAPAAPHQPAVYPPPPAAPHQPAAYPQTPAAPYPQPPYVEPAAPHSAYPQAQPPYVEPAYEQPVYPQAQPSYPQPAYSQPAYEQPSYPQPAYEQPAYAQPPASPYHYGQPAPAGHHPPGALADQVPGAIAHEGYTGDRFTRHQPAVGPDGRPIQPETPDEPRTLNRWALLMLALFLAGLIALIWPQYRARSTEHELKPLVVGLAGPGMWARCPRYITSVFTYVGAVTLDGKGNLSDHTELTGPVCAGLRHLYTPAGRAEMSCLVTTGDCPQSALNSVIALSTITHESMHLRGVLDEGNAECTSIAAAPRAAVLAGLTEEEGRMIGYLHLTGLNPDTPPQYRLTPANCKTAAELFANPPGTPEARNRLTAEANRTWRAIAGG